MPKKQTLSISGMELDADEFQFKVLDEPWSTYELENGARIQVRLAANRIFLLPQPDPQTGGPAFYVVGSTVSKPV